MSEWIATRSSRRPPAPMARCRADTRLAPSSSWPSGSPTMSMSIVPAERIGHHQRRRGEIVHLHVRVDATLEVAIARQHRHDREIALADRLGHLLRQRPRVADAGGAAVADEVEAELLQRLGQARLVEVLGHHLRAGRQRGLHPRLALQAAGERVAGEDPRADHHRRVGRVGAARDRRDHHVAMVERGLAAVGHLQRHRPPARARGAPS